MKKPTTGILTPKLRLSPHFTLGEAIKSQTALRHGIDNMPPQQIVPYLVDTAENILEPIRAKYKQPFSPSSWYRCPLLNTLLKGSRNSAHIKGYAVDFEVPGITNFEVARWLSQNLEFDNLILEFYDGLNAHSGWIHISYIKGNNRGRVQRYDGKRFQLGLE